MHLMKDVVDTVIFQNKYFTLAFIEISGTTIIIQDHNRYLVHILR